MIAEIVNTSSLSSHLISNIAHMVKQFKPVYLSLKA